jgi:hypothetical protein
VLVEGAGHIGSQIAAYLLLEGVHVKDQEDSLDVLVAKFHTTA